MPRQIDVERKLAHIQGRHAIYVLWLLREKKCTSFNDLLEHFDGCDEFEGLDFVKRSLHHLVQNNFVEIRNGAGERIGDKREMYRYLEDEPHALPASAGGPPETHGYHVLGGWTDFARDMGISLSKIASIAPGMSEVVSPFFGKATTTAQHDVFVAMPFLPKMKAIYDDHIRMTVLKTGLTCARGDDFSTHHSIIKDVWHAIKNAKCVVADCTASNPNVFYEIGIAHTVGIPTILITQDKGQMPFNLTHVRRLEYSADDNGLKELERNLELMLKEVVSG